MRTIKLFTLALLLTIGIGNVAHAQTSKQYWKAILEDFCQTYYSNAFDGKKYIKGSLYVTSVESDESEDILLIRGRHSYKGKDYGFGRITHEDVSFKAEVSQTRSGIKIKFWKWYKTDILHDGHWEGPCTKTIVP